MKKTLEITYDDSVFFNLVSYLNSLIGINKIKELPQSKYCKCSPELSVGVCCDACYKPFKDNPKLVIEPKPRNKIEKLRDLDDLEIFNPTFVLENRDKINESIDYINKGE